MITIPTVLVLGAGASKPFGFPLGAELKNEVCELLSDKVGRLNEFKKVAACILPDLASRAAVLREALAFSGLASVDSFLEHRVEFLDIGKAAIAYTLIKYEGEGRLFPSRERDWYRYLFQRIWTNFDDFGENELAVVNFNYDRSLEHYLFKALSNSSGRRPLEVAAKLREIPIVHVYGSLGRLPWQEGDQPSRAYDPSTTESALRAAVDNLSIIHEGSSRENLISAQSLLEKAEQIIFLGFGYHPLNLERLGFQQVTEGKAAHRILGTAYGLKRAEVTMIKTMAHSRLTLVEPELDCLGFLREHAEWPWT